MRSSSMIRPIALLLALAGVTLPAKGTEAIAPALGAKPSLSLSLVPWTGPQLPGSVPETLKYRLTIVGSSGEAVDLRAAGVPKGWIATFCTDRICTPNRTRITLGASRVKVVEFQLVPPGVPGVVPQVRVIGTGSEGKATATT